MDKNIKEKKFREISRQYIKDVAPLLERHDVNNLTFAITQILTIRFGWTGESVNGYGKTKGLSI